MISDWVVTEFAAALSVKTRTARATIVEPCWTLRQQAQRSVLVSHPTA